MALPPVTIQQARIATSKAPTKTLPVFLYAYVQINENTITCGANTINSDINGPPNVVPKIKSAPGPIPIKNGMYSKRMIKRMPPTILSAYFHHTLKKALTPSSPVPLTRLPVKIFELFKMKNRAKNGIYTKNCNNRAPVKSLKNGQIKRKSFELSRSCKYIQNTPEITTSADLPSKAQSNLFLYPSSSRAIPKSTMSGAGAAEGIGAGILAFGNGTLQKGIETILDLVKFTEHVQDTDYVISGEGKLDEQSFYGKTISGIATLTQKHNKKLILIVGTSTVTLNAAKQVFPCISHIIETNPTHLPFAEIIENAATMYRAAVDDVLNLITE